jgi:pSer/pThr/pTyr-binding forkhead associated (FHA) protein
MASEPKPKVASGRTPGGRTTAVLVPQAALAGQADIPLDRPVTTVGSNDNARLHLVSRTVSKGHAIFINSGGVTYVADLASRTGVIVNGKLIKDTDLKTGDRVQIGKFVFRYRSPANLAPPPPAIMPPSAAVIVVGSPAKTIDGRVFQIGRKENCEISFPTDAAVSAGHAVIFEMDGRWYLRDLGSRTGTVVNGKPIHQQVLNFGDRIVIGSSTILFQPGAARVEDFDDSEIGSDALSETAELPVEAEREEEAVVPTPQAAADDDAIPLADDFPANAIDWKTAFRGTDPDQEAAAAELEAAVEPVFTEPQAAAGAEAIEVSPISIDDVLQPASIDPEPADEVPIAVEPEPIEPIAVEPEAIPLEEVAAIAVDPEPIPITEVTEPVAVEHEPIPAVEPKQTAPQPMIPVADLAEPVEDFVFIPIDEQADPNALPDLIFWGDADLDSATEQAVTIPVVPESSFVKAEEPPVAATPEIPADQADEVTPKAAVESIESPPAAEVQAVDENAVEVEFSAPVSVDTVNDAPAAPPVAVNEITKEPSVEAVVDHVDEIIPTADVDVIADISAETALDVAPIAEIAEEPVPEITVDHVGEIIPSVEPIAVEGEPVAVAETLEPIAAESEPVEDVSDGLPPADLAGIFDESVADTEQAPVAATPASPMDFTAGNGDAVVAAAEDFEFQAEDAIAPAADAVDDIVPPANTDVSAEAAIEVMPAEPVVDVVNHSSEVIPSADSAIDDVSIEPTLDLGPPELAEDVAAEFELVQDSEVEQEISLLEDSGDSAAEPVIDPLADSFPSVQPVEDVALPHDLHAFSAASAATADVYGHGSAAPEPAIESPAGDLSSFPVAEELSSDSEPVEKFIDVASDIDLAPEITSTAVEPSIDESFDLDDLEFLEPGLETVTQTAMPADLSGISTVDEIPGDDEGEHASGFDEVDAEHEPAAVEEAPPELPDFAGTIHEVDQPTDIAGISVVDEISTDDSVTLSEDLAPPIEEPESNESDLEFLDHAPEAPETAEPPPTAAAPQTPAVTGGPSIFGIQFEGGSFLGGMPISLREKPPATPPATASPSPVFDSRSTRPTGLDGMIAPPPPAVVPQAPEQIKPAGRSTTPPTPLTPPRPIESQPTAPAPTSLSGLVSDAHLPWAVPPVIPPTTRPATPPAKPGVVKKALSSNFTAAAGEKPRVAEVFSQMSAPIGVEVFGGRPGDPNQFNVPETKKAEDEKQDLVTAPTPVIGLPPAKKPRRSMLPVWLLLWVVVPTSIFGLVHRYWPVNIPIIGSLTFDGLVSPQSIDDAHTFRDVTQPMLIRSDEVRQHAQAILEQEGLPDGFTHDQESYSEIFKPEFLNWDQQKTFQFTYNTTNLYLGNHQVAAVMTALAEKNQNLISAKETANSNARAAKRALDESAVKITQLQLQHRQLLAQAQEYPDAMIVAQAEQDTAALNQQWADAKTIRANSEKVLADLRTEDPTKVIDIEADQQVQDLRNQLQPILDQIAKLRGVGSVDAGSKAAIGTDVSVGATTQPDTNIDPLINPLQERADVLSKKLDQRRAELAAEVALGPEQRAVNLSREIEDLSVKITNLKKTEADAEVAAKQATAKSTDLHAKVTAARLAGAQAQDLESKLAEAKQEQKQRRVEQEKQEAILASCITPSGSPRVDEGPKTDIRTKLAASFAIGTLLFFTALIIGELRRPRLIAGVTPAAAPLANPPVRLIPWPQPREVNGSGEEHQPVGEPEQMLGV